MKKRIIITAGATSEQVDKNLKLVDCSHKGVGFILADHLLTKHYHEIQRIYFVATENALLPTVQPAETDKLEVIRATDAKDLFNKVHDLLKSYNIDAVVHTAKTRAYKLANMVQTDYLAEELWEGIQSGLISNLEDFKATMICPNSEYSMNLDDTPATDFILRIEPTTDVFAYLRTFAQPETTIVGFTSVYPYHIPTMNAAAETLRAGAGADYVVAMHIGNNYPNETQALIVGARNMQEHCGNITDMKEKLTKLLLK